MDRLSKEQSPIDRRWYLIHIGGKFNHEQKNDVDASATNGCYSWLW